jgi:NAD(P)-dependent dehydrogenase (short-subunit alcohol dehydrogenase family)/putative sterol carrier protein
VVIDRGVVEWLSPAELERREKMGAIHFDGRVAVVTGAGAGLGRIYALMLAEKGARVVVNDLGGTRDGSGASTSAADQVVEEIRAAGGQAVANYDNVATPEGGANIVRTAIDHFGRVDIVINNAGILRDKTLVKMEPETWNAVLDVHLNGAYHVTRPAFVKMREQGYGRIVFTTSAAGLYGNFGQTNYSAAKMGLVGLMNTLKAEGQKYNIKVNTVAPVAATRLTEDILPPDLLAKLKPEFVAPLVLYLCSEQCPADGRIYNAGMGYFNRAAVVTGPGTVAGDGVQAPTPEQVASVWAGVKKIEGAEEYPNATAAFSPMLDAFNPKKAPAGETEAAPSVDQIFENLPTAFRPEAAADVDVVFLFDISGPGGGQWSVKVQNNECELIKGAHEAPSCTLVMGDEDFIQMMTGGLSPMKAFTTGKLKITGDVMKSQLIEKLFEL